MRRISLLLDPYYRFRSCSHSHHLRGRQQRLCRVRKWREAPYLHALRRRLTRGPSAASPIRSEWRSSAPPTASPSAALYGASKVKHRSEGTVIFLHSSFLVRPGSPFLRPDPQFSTAVARRGGQGRATIARPRGLVLDGSEHDGTVGWWGRRLEGSSPFAARDQSHRNLVCGGPGDPNHDAVLRIGREAPKRQVHSSLRHDSHCSRRMPATSNRHRRHITCACAPKAAKNPTGSFNAPGAERDQARRLRERGATTRSTAFVPKPRSSSCVCRVRRLSASGTIGPMRCPSGTLESATRIRSCRTARERCQIARGPFLAASPRSRRVSRSGQRSAPRPAGRACRATAPPAPACQPSRCRDP